MDDDIPVFSRSAGLFAELGNADAELKTRVSDDDADAFRRLARSHGLNTSQMLRVMVMTRLHGVKGVATMAASHLAAVAGEGPESAHAEGQPR